MNNKKEDSPEGGILFTLYQKIYISLSFRLQNGLNSLEHTLLLDEVEILLNQLCQARNSLVEIFLPDVVESKNTLSHLLSIASSPELCQLVDNLLVVLWLDLCTISTLATLVK